MAHFMGAPRATIGRKKLFKLVYQKSDDNVEKERVFTEIMDVFKATGKL